MHTLHQLENKNEQPLLKISSEHVFKIEKMHPYAYE